MENAITFGAQAETYAAARPHYPDALFDWISTQARNTDLVWDVGTGSGQAAKALAQRFSHVHATDIDRDQIAHAAGHARIDYACSPADQSGLAARSVDAITAATALHWFTLDLFWAEVTRVAKPGAVFCAWTYHRAVTDDDVQDILLDPILDILEPYWSEGNRLSWRGYSPDELAMPFEVMTMPEFTCHLSWTPTQIAAMACSWSAHKKARMDGHEDRLKQIEQDALARLDSTPRSFVLPINTLAGRIKI